MKKEILAKTFTLVYDEMEDRIRLAINYQDAKNRIDLMITRNFVIKLSHAADEFILKYYSEETLAKDDIILSTKEQIPNNTSPTDEVNFELYRTSQELLTEVNFSFDSNTKNTVLTLMSKNFITKAILDVKSLSKVFEIIKASIPHFKWGISQYF